jgi:hypothetical protein
MAAEVGAACVVATAAVLAMVGHGDFSSPPRYDGAGYAVLARSLVEGKGYRAIDHPDQPRHAHFPPGYPALLALVRGAAGESAHVYHLASCLCTLGATLAAWWWFRRMYSRKVALALGLALAVNWIWARTGTAIQSEPLYELLGQSTILAAMASTRRRGQAVLLGGLMAACLLTRHVAIGLVAAVPLDLALRGRWGMALKAASIAAVLVGPWIGWIEVVGGTGRTQASLLALKSQALPARVLAQAAFYVRRLPDQVTGPLVEVATSFRRSPPIEVAANLWAILATGLIFLGWSRTIRRPRRRLAGLVPLATLALLVAWPYTEAGRFLIPLIPCLLVGTVEGLADLGRLLRITRRPATRRGSILIAAWLVLMASVPYSAYAILSGRARIRDAANRDFDAACAWLVREGVRPGPVLTHHPGEVFLATGRPSLEVSTSERPGEADASPGEVARAIDRYHVVYLVLDEARYAGAPRGPLSRFIADRSGRLREVWRRGQGASGVSIYEVLPEGR